MTLATAKPRSSFYDNVKAVLIFLVILGHTLTNFHSSAVDDLYQFIYIFHMPCFVFVSGFFSKKGIGFKQIIAQYLVLAVMFQLLYYVLYYALGHHISLRSLLTTPITPLWYLFSLGVWVYLLNFINIKHLKYYIIASFVIT